MVTRIRSVSVDRDIWPAGRRRAGQDTDCGGPRLGFLEIARTSTIPGGIRIEVALDVGVKKFSFEARAYEAVSSVRTCLPWGEDAGETHPHSVRLFVQSFGSHGFLRRLE
jgi:hypothetical protein